MLSFMLIDLFQILVLSVILYKFPLKERLDFYLEIIVLGALFGILSKIAFYYFERSSLMLYSISSTTCFTAMSHLYLREFLSGKSIGKMAVFLHLIPFFLTILFFIGKVTDQLFFTRHLNSVDMLLSAVTANIRTWSLVCYLLLDLLYVCMFWHKVKRQFRSVNGSIITYFVLHKLLLATLIFFHGNGLKLQSMTMYIGLLSMPILFVVVVYYKVLKGTRLKLDELQTHLRQQVNTADERTRAKYVKSNLDGSKFDQLAQKLEHYMERQQPFLQMDFSSGKLTEAMQVTQHDLSILMNQRLHTSFYEYINAYRIQYFLDHIDRISSAEITILALAFEAGFNSKSTFNKYFRQRLGCSPTAYLNKLALEEQSYIVVK